MSLINEDNFGFDFCQYELFSVDAEEVEEDSFKEFKNFLPSSTI